MERILKTTPGIKHDLCPSPSKGFFYYCAVYFPSETCHKWDTFKRIWTDTGHRPAYNHYSAPIIHFPDGRIALLGGRDDSGILDIAQNEVMNPDNDDKWTEFQPFPNPTRNAVGCLISESRLIGFGGLATGIGNTHMGWVWDIDADTRSPIANTVYHHHHGPCVKIGDNEVMVVGSWPGLHEVEIYDIAMNTWTNHPEYYFPVRISTPQMAFYKGKILVLGGYDADTGLSLDTVWEWDQISSTWIAREKKLPYGVGWINGAITTFTRTVVKPNC